MPIGRKESIKLPDDPDMHALEDIIYSDDDEDVGAEADMNNLDAFMLVSPIPTTRVHKDHPIEQIIRDLNSTPQTRRTTKNLEERDVKSDFLYGKIEKEVYVCQPPGFEDPNFPDRKSLYTEFEKMMHKKFQTSSISELTFFLGLQAKQKEDRIFISQEKYVTKILKKFDFTDVKTASTPMETQKPCTKDEDGEEVDVYLYRLMIGSLIYLTSARPDIMFAVCACARYQGASLDRKSTTGVAFLAKPDKSEGFKQIVDFLNANPIRYALTINPTIYTSCIEQFWAIIKVKTVNGEVQLQALVDGNKIIVTKASVRRDLQLNDEEGMDCFPNATIFEEHTRMGKQKPRKPKRKDIEVPQPSGPIDNVENKVIYEEMDDSLKRAATTATSLDAEQDRGNINKTQSKATLNEPSSIGTSSGSGPMRQETMGDTIAQTRSENISKLSNDLLLAREYKDCSSLGDYKFETKSQEVREESKIKNSQAQKIIQEITLVDETQGRASTPTPKSFSQQPITGKDAGQELFDKAMKRVNTFFDYRTELVKGSSKKTDAEMAQESSSKRARNKLEQESVKKQKVDEDKETA
ncbi:uncharacterized mitochondrial protein-like protein [Tanacetum coccineum]